MSARTQVPEATCTEAKARRVEGRATVGVLKSGGGPDLPDARSIGVLGPPYRTSLRRAVTSRILWNGVGSTAMI